MVIGVPAASLRKFTLAYCTQGQPPICQAATLLSGFGPTFRFHEVGENVIDACQVPFAFRFQPLQDARIKSHAHWDLRPDVAQSHHFCQLFLGQARNLVVVDARIVARGLPCGAAAGGIEFSLRPAPALDIV